MNHQIKFRIWSKLDLNDPESDPIMMYPGDEYLEEIYFDGLPWDEKESGVLMQFTGTKDSLGQDIYEGDILRFSYCDDDYEYLYIKYGKAYAVYGLIPYNLNGEPWDFYGGWPNEEFEIIGNIYENEELLKL